MTLSAQSDTSAQPPVDVDVQYFPDHVEYRLPKEPGIVWWALLLVVISIGCFAAPQLGVFSKGDFKLYGFAALSLVGAVIAFFARERIEVWQGKIVAVFVIGPLAFPRNRATQNEPRLIVAHTLDNVAQVPKKDDYRVFVGDMRLTGGYPRAWCDALRASIAGQIARLNAAGTHVPATSQSRGAAVEPRRSALGIQIKVPPGGSGIEVSEQGDGIVIGLPPIGWNVHTGVTVGLGAIGVVVAFVLLVFRLFNNAKVNVAQADWVALLIIGALFLCWGLLFSRRHGALAIAENRAMFIERGIFGTKRREIDLVDFKSAEIGEHFLSTRRSRFPVLWVTHRNGRREKFFAGRTEQEIQWLASVLEAAAGRGN